jgi:Effector-associated domain 1
MTSAALKRQTALRDALGKAYGPDTFAALLNSIGRDFAQYQVTGSDFRANLLHVVDAARQERWLSELLGAAAAQVPADQGLQRLAAEIQLLAPSAGLDHYDVCRLSGNLLMLNRSRLRQSVRTFASPTSNRILVVQGDDQSGKSHTAWFISYLAVMLGAFNYHLIDLSAAKRVLGADAPVEPDWVAQKLVGGLKYEMTVAPAPATGSWATWILNFCDAFENEAREDPVPRWIVIDAFNAVVVTQNALDLIKELTVRVSQTLSSFRLFLLGFGTEDPPDLPREAFAHLEKTERLSAIRVREVIEFFAQAFTQAGISFDEDMVVAAALRVFEGLDPSRADFLLTLTSRVGDELAEVIP